MSLRPDRSPNEETTEEQALIKPDDDTKPGIKFKIREIETDIAKQQELLTQIRKKLSRSESNIAMEMERLERMSECGIKDLQSSLMIIHSEMIFGANRGRGSRRLLNGNKDETISAKNIAKFGSRGRSDQNTTWLVKS
ncbi:predicted protein [Coccidioides posadasii str. Silveira]|uniref:Predicted protein n=1 Tax=Coccidioides posadasii (strain RMSCC 757 / Silveira) TaxID=443226 RepID=E9D6R7_COCPS|nr:predicted protein [Coccidioides posadasii str. Silveira]